MKKILLIFMAAFLSMQAVAKICMTNNPSIIATQEQLADVEDNSATKAELAVQVALLSARIAALESQPTDLSWLSTWSNASGTLPGSSYAGDNSSPTWSVTAYYADSGTKTISGSSLCSNTGGLRYNIGDRGNPSETGDYRFNCWCKMTAPRAGVWIYIGGGGGCNSNNYNYCSSTCARNVRETSTVRTAVLALP